LHNFEFARADTTKLPVYYRTRPDRWGYLSNNTSPDLTGISFVKPSHQKYLEKHALSVDAFFEDLHLLGKTSRVSGVKVLVIGPNPSRRCAVILTSVEQEETQPVIRYYFPLKA
jgi:hypothetical protein